MKKYPDIKIELELSERVIDLVEDNVDIAIRSVRLPDSNLIAGKLMDNNFILCASPEYLNTHGSPENTESLADYDCIRYGYSGWRDWFVIKGKARKLTIKEGLVVNSVNGQKQLLLNHAGLALIPTWAVKTN